MSSLSDNQRQKLIQEVFTCFQKSIGVVVDGRQSPQPTEDSTNRPVGHVENSKYIGVVTRVAELDPFVPICLEIFYSDASRNNLVRLEKWLFSYNRDGGGYRSAPLPNSGSQGGAPPSVPPSSARRIGLLMRTVYCFARLLPSFYINTSSSIQLFYRISYSDITSDSHVTSKTPAIDHRYDANVLAYQFPVVPLPLGSIAMSVLYMDPNTLQSVVGPAMAPVRALQQQQRVSSSDQSQGQGQGQYLSQGQMGRHQPGGGVPLPDSSRGAVRRHSMGGAQSHSVPVTIPPELQQQYQQQAAQLLQQQQQQQYDMSRSQGGANSGGRSSAIPIYASSSPPISIPGYQQEQQPSQGSVGSGGGGGVGAGRGTSLQNQQQMAQYQQYQQQAGSQGRGRLHSGASPSGSDTNSAAGSMGSSQQHMRPPIGPSSHNSQTHMMFGGGGGGGHGRRHSRTESFDDPSGPGGAGAFCLAYSNSPSSAGGQAGHQQDPCSSLHQPLVAYWAGSSPTTAGQLQNQLQSNKQQQVAGSFGQSLPGPSPPYMQCSPTLLSYVPAADRSGGAHTGGVSGRSGEDEQQSQYHNTPPLRSYSGPSAPLVGAAAVAPMLQQLLAKSDAWLNSGAEPTFVKFPDGAGGCNGFEVMLAPLQRSPFDSRSQRAEREKDRLGQDSTLSGSVSGGTGASGDGTSRLSFGGGPPMDIIRESDDEHPDAHSVSDSDSDSSQDDMPFAWVPDAAVEKSPPKVTNSKKELSPSRIGDFSPRKFPGGIPEGNTPTGSIQKQCANPPPLLSFSEREGQNQQQNQGASSKRALLADRKTILDAINANYVVVSKMVADYD